jgi:hypothetical protein
MSFVLERIDLAGAARSGQSQPAKNNGDQPQHQGRCATGDSVAAAETTSGDGQIQPAVDCGDQPRHQGDHRTPSSVTRTDATGGSEGKSTDDHAAQAFATGYDKGKSDAVKQQYWLYISMQKQRDQVGSVRLYPVQLPEQRIDGVTFQPSTKLLRIEE